MASTGSRTIGSGSDSSRATGSRAVSDFGIAGDDGGHLFADETDAVLRKNVAILHVEAEAIREVLAGDHADHAGQFFGGAGVDIQDAGVSLGAFDDAGVVQAGAEFEVVGETRGAGDLFPAVDALGGMADDFGVEGRVDQGFELNHVRLRSAGGLAAGVLCALEQRCNSRKEPAAETAGATSPAGLSAQEAASMPSMMGV